MSSWLGCKETSLPDKNHRSSEHMCQSLCGMNDRVVPTPRQGWARPPGTGGRKLVWNEPSKAGEMSVIL